MAPTGLAFCGPCLGKIDSADEQVSPRCRPIYELAGHIFFFPLGAVFFNPARFCSAAPYPKNLRRRGCYGGRSSRATEVPRKVRLPNSVSFTLSLSHTLDCVLRIVVSFPPHKYPPSIARRKVVVLCFDITTSSYYLKNPRFQNEIILVDP